MRRLRSFILAAGTLLSPLIVAAFVASAFWWIVFQVPTSRGPAVYSIAGCAMIRAGDMIDAPLLVKRSIYGVLRWNDWHAERGMLLCLPLYAVLLAVAVPTLLVCRFVPKFPRGHCRRCGYNLTGLTEARCPECGAEFEVARGKDD